MSGQPFLDVRDLRVHFATDDGLVRSVDGVSFAVERGRTLGIVGESGSGKSVTSQAVMGLLERTNARISGEVWLDGEELVSAEPDVVRKLRGLKMAMIFQDPLSSMHPYYPVGRQIMEAYRVHNDVPKSVARARAVDLLGRVGIPEPTRRVDDYPHQFSGGMRQRAMIAMALACDPSLLIADDILVMYAGKAVEYGSSSDVFRAPEHPYTWGLLSSVPRMDRARQERLVPIVGSPPSLINVPRGCAFHPRCPYEPLTDGRGSELVPELVNTSVGHAVRCHLAPAERRRIFKEEVAPRL